MSWRRTCHHTQLIVLFFGIPCFVTMNEPRLSSALSKGFIILVTLYLFELLPGINAFVSPSQPGMVTWRNSIYGPGKIRTSFTGVRMDIPSQAEQFISILLSDSTTSTGAAAGDVVTSNPTDFSPFGQGTRGLSYYSTLALYGTWLPPPPSSILSFLLRQTCEWYKFYPFFIINNKYISSLVVSWAMEYHSTKHNY